MPFSLDNFLIKKMVNEQQTQMLTMLAQGLSTPPRTPIFKAPKDYGIEFE